MKLNMPKGSIIKIGWSIVVFNSTIIDKSLLFLN